MSGSWYYGVIIIMRIMRILTEREREREREGGLLFVTVFSRNFGNFVIT